MFSTVADAPHADSSGSIGEDVQRPGSHDSGESQDFP